MKWEQVQVAMGNENELLAVFWNVAENLI